MIKNEGDRKKQACIDGQFQEGQEGFRNAKCDQIDMKGGITKVSHQWPGKEEINDSGQKNKKD